MIRYLSLLMAAFVIYTAIPVAVADDSKVTNTHAIPYKTTETPLQQNGSRIGWVIIGFLLVAWGVSYYITKKNPKVARNLFSKASSQIKVLDSIRLNPRSHLYVVEFDQKKLLIGQSGDTIATLSESSLEKNEQVSSNV